MGIRLDDRQRRDWLRLIRTEGIGPRTFQGLVNRFGGAGAALEALPEVSRRAGRPLAPPPLAEIEAEMEDAARLGVRFLCLGEDDYPASLRAIDTAPPVLSVRGQVAALKGASVGLVGSRNASAAGLRFAGVLAAALGQAGFRTVSGLARGIDTAVHQASLETGTIAVLAGGLSRPYPPQNLPLLDALCERGAAISEMPLAWAPRGRDFPRRNRLVSGLSLGVVVVEAARGSGSLITARFALEQGRDVFAVPGSPLDPRAEGTNDLIRQGASLCADPAHVIDALSQQGYGGPEQGALFETAGEGSVHEALWDEIDLTGFMEEGAGIRPLPLAPSRSEQPPGVSAGRDDPVTESLERRLLDLLGPQPTPIDDLVRLSGARAQAVVAAILEMEISGQVRRAGLAGVMRA